MASRRRRSVSDPGDDCEDHARSRFFGVRPARFLLPDIELPLRIDHHWTDDGRGTTSALSALRSTLRLACCHCSQHGWITSSSAATLAGTADPSDSRQNRRNAATRLQLNPRP